MKLKDAMQAAKNKHNTEKHNNKFISFSFAVGPYVSVTERIFESINGGVKCYSAFVFNKKYDAKRCVDTDEKQTKQIKKQESACEIIKNHHGDMKDDPERLTTDFLLKLINIECKGENKL